MGRNYITDNELDLLDRLKLTAGKQLYSSSERKGGRALKNLGRGNRQSPTSFMRGDQNESWVQSKISASSLALSSQACNQRKKLGSPESNKGPELPLLNT